MQHNPDYTFCLGWVDSAPLNNLPPWVQLIRADELPIAQWESMIGQYCELELQAAIKPFLIRRLVSTFPDYQHLIYFAPTTQVFGCLEKIVDPSAFIQLTPNRTEPIDEAAIEGLDDKRILNIGMYHAGAIIFHQSEQLDTLLNWWEERAIDRHYLNLCDGMALDQLWLNYLPIYFDNVKTIRNSTWHIGLHSLIGESYTFNKNYVLSVDFAGIAAFHPIWSDHTKQALGHLDLSILAKAYMKRLAEMNMYVPQMGDIYGNKVTVGNFRGLRKRVVKALATVVSGIEQYNLTYN